MKKIIEFISHPLNQIALATGLSIIALAFFSKRVLPEPLSYLELALPPFLATVFEAVTKKKKAAWFSRPLFGILAILFSTVLVVWLNW